MRLCIDYHALNCLTVKNIYPLTRVDDIFDQLRNARYFTNIDLHSGHHQLRMEDGSIALTAFRTRYGHFELLVLPFGLTNAPAIFMSLMKDVFLDCPDRFVLVYLGDILVFSNTVEEYAIHLRKVLSRLRSNKLYGKLSKREFFKSKVEYLGHTIGNEGISMDYEKLNVIVNYSFSQKRTDVQAFLGMVNYNRKLIKNWPSMAKSLTLHVATNPSEWNSEEQHSFE